tara:strand:+ start:6929 stop:7054 length:126 start_codon:yes stop_codon:yes gene_type:complete
MESIITSIALAVAMVLTYGFVNYYERKGLKRCKIYYLPRRE